MKRTADPTPAAVPTTAIPTAPVPTTHIYVLLDRSGSMETMATDVIGGFNGLIADQAREGDDARVTLVQFDSVDPDELVFDALPVKAVPPLTADRFTPRGGTPLLDATGSTIARAAVREQTRKALGKRPESIVIVTITDGEENQSHRYSREQIARLIKAREADGWTFAFLGAGLDAYAEAGALGVDTRSVQAFAPSPAGARAAFASASEAIVERRSKMKAGEAVDTRDFFGGHKPAEAQRDAS